MHIFEPGFDRVARCAHYPADETAPLVEGVLSLVHHDEVIAAVKHWCGLADETHGGWSESNF